MHYYVDGYNLLFRHFLNDSDLKSQREQVIKELNAKIDIVHIDISLVFDASFMPGEGTKAHYKHLEILYTSYGEIADDFIIRKLKTECSLPQQEVVVTSDKRLAWRAKCAGAHVQLIEEFLSWLNKSYKNKLRHRKIEKTDAVAVVTTHKRPSEGSLEYYLHAFETRYEILAEAQRSQKKIKTRGFCKTPFEGQI
jgi:uncharacterized protein